MERQMMARAPAYMKELEAWGKADSVKTHEKYEHEVIPASSEYKRLAYDASALARDFSTGRFHAGEGFDKAGNWNEWVNNHDLKVIFEELYQIKEDFKALALSPVAV